MSKNKKSSVQVEPEVMPEEGAVEVVEVVEEPTEKAVAKPKKGNKEPSNVELIIRQLKKTNDLDKVKKSILSIKPEYLSKANGEKVLGRQIANVYEMIKGKDKRFAKRVKIDSKTGLVVEVDDIDKEIAKHSKKKTE